MERRKLHRILNWLEAVNAQTPHKVLTRGKKQKAGRRAAKVSKSMDHTVSHTDDDFPQKSQTDQALQARNYPCHPF
jgi:hypothetical protein